MKLLRNVLLALTFTRYAFGADAASPEMVEQKLIALAGAGSHNCGTIPLGSDYKAAFACAKNGISSGTAFRVARQVQGVDSFIWEGAARDEKGNIWAVLYDSDPSGGSRAAPVLNVTQCHNLAFSVQGRDALECSALVDEP